MKRTVFLNPLTGLAALAVIAFSIAWNLVSHESRPGAGTIPSPNAEDQAINGNSTGDDRGTVSLVEPADWKGTEPAEVQDIKSLFRTREPENELLALELVADLPPEDSWNLLNAAYQSKSAQVRAEAVLIAGRNDDGEKAADFLSRAIMDPSKYVGFTVLEATDEQSRLVRSRVFSTALETALPEISSAVIGELEIQSDFESMEILFRGLDSPVAETREETRFSFEFMFDQTFHNATEARAWWSQNRYQYHRDLTMK